MLRGQLSMPRGGVLNRHVTLVKITPYPCYCHRLQRYVRCSSASDAARSQFGDNLSGGQQDARQWIENWRSKQAAQANGNGVSSATAPVPAPASVDPPKSESEVMKYLHLWSGLGVLYSLDYALKLAMLKVGWKFPASLVGMFIVFVALCLAGKDNAKKMLDFFMPALNWIARWLPLFYVPSLVTLPLALSGMAVDNIVKIVGVLSVGMVGTLLFTGYSAVFIRNAVKTPMKEVPKSPPAPPFQPLHYVAWGAITVASLALTLINTQMYGVVGALGFNLGCTVGGYLLGVLVPKGMQGVLHPVVVTALLANAGAAFHGALRGLNYDQSQVAYFLKGTSPLGPLGSAGDLLMNLLGMVIISFGFRIYQQRETMARHWPEIMGATVLSSLFSLFSTAFMVKALMLPTDIGRALVPRSVTVALALPIAVQLDAPLAITAAAVLLQGIIGANFGPNLLTVAGVKDTIARGLSAAATAGGLGTASLTSKEPEALPFCALSYSMIGILSTLFMQVPAIRALLISIVGA